MKVGFLRNGRHYSIEFQQNGHEYVIEADGKRATASLLKVTPQAIHLQIDGTELQVLWAKQGRKIWLHFGGRSYYVEKQIGSAIAGAAASGERVLRAPMPGQVLQILTEDGQVVKAGETLVLLEAMKMEIRIQAPSNGKVARVAVKQGQVIEKDQVLVEMEA